MELNAKRSVGILPALHESALTLNHSQTWESDFHTRAPSSKLGEGALAIADARFSLQNAHSILKLLSDKFFL